jgi:hypothetical protein
MKNVAVNKLRLEICEKTALDKEEFLPQGRVFFFETD